MTTLADLMSHVPTATTKDVKDALAILNETMVKDGLYSTALKNPSTSSPFMHAVLNNDEMMGLLRDMVIDDADEEADALVHQATNDEAVALAAAMAEDDEAEDEAESEDDETEAEAEDAEAEDEAEAEDDEEETFTLDFDDDEEDGEPVGKVKVKAKKSRKQRLAEAGSGGPNLTSLRKLLLTKYVTNGDARDADSFFKALTDEERKPFKECRSPANQVKKVKREIGSYVPKTAAKA